MIAFIHIPKTAGTSLQAAFEQLYGKEACFFTTKWEDGEKMLTNPESFTKYSVVGGHLPIGYFQRLPIKHYVSIFRRPIARYVSHYRYICRTPEHPLHDQVKSMTLLQFLEFDNRRNEQCFYFGSKHYQVAFEAIVNPPTMVVGTMDSIPYFVKRMRKYIHPDFPDLPKLNIAEGELEIAPKVADEIALRILQDVQLYHAVRIYLNQLTLNEQ